MPEETEEMSVAEFELLLDYIKRSRAFDYGGYKRPGLQRRVLRRMQAVNVASYADYIDYLEVHPDEFTHLFNTILINVTAFFRDPETWEYVRSELLPRLLKGKRDTDPIRVWSAACASGEEAYTLAMVLLEALGQPEYERRVKIFATDLDEEALAHARLGSYTEQEVEGVPAELLDKYFERQGNRYAFKKDLRRALIFGRHDLMQDAPIPKIDLLTCRNALMYFNSEAQGRCLERFHFALNDTGVMLLGKAEMLFSRLQLFAPLDLKRRAFAKVQRNMLRDRLLVAADGGGGGDPGADGGGLNSITGDGNGRAADGARGNGDLRLREAAFNVDPVGCVVFDPAGTVVFANEQARLLFHLRPHDVGRPIQDLELSYRPVELRSRIEHAVRTAQIVEMKDVSWPGPGGETRHFDVQVIPLIEDAGGALGVKVTFQDVTRFRRLQEELQQSHQELETAYEELQSTNEERETANEELRSTNEELETTNEEIQSTNEELETMNEELQSTNEELQATNDQLRQRTDELSEANAFLRSILASLSIGVAVVDKDLRVRAWNDKAHDMWGLRSSEVVGQHFLALDIGLPVDKLRAVLKSCLAGDPTDGELRLPATNRRGRSVDCRVKCTPVEADGAGVTGVILTMDEEREGQA